MKQRFTRPYTSRTNGKAERFIQTALREWAYAGPYLHSDERAANGLGLAPPISCSGLNRNNVLRHHS